VAGSEVSRDVMSRFRQAQRAWRGLQSLVDSDGAVVLLARRGCGPWYECVECSMVARFRDSTFNKQRAESGGAPYKAW
jgi:hypothetical protein